MLYIKALAAPLHGQHDARGHAEGLRRPRRGRRAAAPPDGGDCEAVLAQFAEAGVDVDALAAQLQDEGAKSFVKSWNELMERDRLPRATALGKPR